MKIIKLKLFKTMWVHLSQNQYTNYTNCYLSVIRENKKNVESKQKYIVSNNNFKRYVLFLFEKKWNWGT